MYISTEKIELESGSIRIVYLDNPETRNSMTLQMGLSFHSEMHKLASEENLPRAVIITGKNGVFSSGGDLGLLKSFAEKSRSENEEFMRSFYGLFLTVREMPFPVIAAVNGHAVGASLALALACDLRYFVPNGKYAFNFVKIGIHPGMGSSWLVKEIAGIGNAQELLLTGKFIDGEEACKRGLCHGLFEKDTILDEVKKIAEELSTGAPAAIRMLKSGLYSNSSLKEALAYEAASQAENYAGEDFLEAMNAVEEKRPPVYNDR